MRKILTIILLILLSLKLGATKVYVATTGNDGTGDGSSGNPYLTVAKGITEASSGDTVFVVAGSYTITGSTTVPVGISIMGEGATSILVMTYVSASASIGCLQLASNPTEGTDGSQSISYLYIDGDLTGTNAIVVYCRKNVKIHDCTIIDFDQSGVYFRGNAVAGEATTKATGCEIYNCRITNSSTRGAVSDGLIRLSSTSGMLIHDNILDQTDKAQGSNGNIIDAVGGYNEGCKYYNNKSYKNDNEGAEWNFHIESWNAKGGIEVYDNLFYGGGTAIDVGGDSNIKGTYDYSWWIHDNVIEQPSLSAQTTHYNIAIDFEREVKDAIVERNYIRNYNWGVYFSCDGYATNLGSDNIRISYNVFENIGTTDNVYAAALMISSQETSLGHEVIYFDNNTMTAGSAFNVGAGVITAIYAGTLDSVFIRNNIIKGFFAGPVWIAADVDPDTIFYQNNHSNNTGDVIYYSAGRAITTLISADNQTGDPVFASTTDLHLQSTSTCIDAGLDVSATTGGLDFHGASLYGAAYDIGAFEYGLNRIILIDDVLTTINYKIPLIDH